MPYENGVNWRPLAPGERGRHATFDSALEAAAAGLLVERNAFFEALVDNWKSVFPELPARPGRYEAGKIFLYVKNAPTLFLLRPRLPQLKRKLLALPGAPKKLELRLEAHAS